ncbi:MAG: hypothetical protein K6T63_02545 [Alicyclobacillus herbarius]|uniref:hypothetical protein n=1 Tax=Alicyclobacillus herbarius TaxID=122960 RepID=UPI002353151B|nr:hypothetical protein [Alicyclobacillus herbarius]MCL6631487.1 hypothetical protein [Alicyclobacillus herbarius]
MIRKEHVLPYIGQRVVVQTRDGRFHHGILHSVVDDGIYLRPIYRRVRPISAPSREVDDIRLLQDVAEGLTETAWFPFWFFPWAFLGGFWLWAWWW